MTLLLQESPLVIQPTLVHRLGLNESLLVQQLHYWMNYATTTHDEKKWVYETYQGWVEKLRNVLSLSSIRRAMTKLIEKGVVICREFRKHGPFDRRRYYTIDLSHELLQQPPAEAEQPVQTDMFEEQPTHKAATQIGENQNENPVVQSGVSEVSKPLVAPVQSSTSSIQENTEHKNTQEKTNKIPNVASNVFALGDRMPKPPNETQYAFEGDVIKLNQQDFDKMLRLYPNLSLRDELEQLDMELRDTKKWWGALHAKLKYRNNNPPRNNQFSHRNRPESVECSEERAERIWRMANGQS